jgi:hypothetical protein
MVDSYQLRVRADSCVRSKDSELVLESADLIFDEHFLRIMITNGLKYFLKVSTLTLVTLQLLDLMAALSVKLKRKRWVFSMLSLE